VGSDRLVGLCVDRSLDLVVGLLGILKSGGAYVPLDPAYPAERLRFMLEDADAPVLLTQERLLEVLPELAVEPVCLDRDWAEIAEHPGTNPGLEIDAESLAYVIYTSGSTGRPKGAMNAHRGVVNRLRWMQEAFGLGPGDAVLQKTPFSFDVSVWEFFWPLMTGARLVLPKPGGHQDPAYLARMIEEHEITVLHFVPSMLQVFLDQPDLRHKCRSVRAVICSGEALSHDLQERFFSTLDAELHNLYGPTEAAVDVTHWPCRRDSAERVVPIGWPIANTQIHILDKQLRQVPVGVEGELHIGGVQVGRGYWKRETLTAEKFIADPFSDTPGARLYKSGDLARWREDGAIEYRGRMDHQVKIRGLRIELGEIEAALEAVEGLNQAAVLVREAGADDQRLVGYYVTASGAPLAAATLRDALAAILPAYMIPQHFVHLDAMPITPNGKLDRKALPEVEAAGPTVGEAPKTAAEKKLAPYWARLLGTEAVHRHSDFFALGGHSILAIKLINTIRDELGMTVPLVSIFDNPTLSGFAKVYEQVAKKGGKKQGRRRALRL